MPVWKEEIRQRLADLRLGPTREAEIIEELAEHLDDRYEDLLASGLTEVEASRTALAELSDSDWLTPELRRAEWRVATEPVLLGANRSGNLIADLWHDTRYAVRMLSKNLVFTTVVVSILALGIGANSAIFSVVSVVLLHPVPWRDADRIINVWETNSKKGENNNLVSAVNFIDWRAHAPSFEQVAAWRFLYLNLTGRDEPERVQGLTVSPSYFSLLGVQATQGRTFLPEEEQPGHDKVVILSHGLWQRRFGSDPNLIGQTITVEGEPYTVIGVLPSDFRTFRVLNRELDVYIPLTLDRTQLGRHGVTALTAGNARSGADQLMFVYARLKPGASLAQAQAEMDTIYTRFAQEYPTTNSGLGVRLVPLPKQWSERSRSALLMLLAAVGFVLLIACANIINLLLARALTRREEMTIRAALGASRLRLVRQLLTESLLTALLGGAAGLLLAFLGIHLLNGLIPYTAVNRATEFSLDLPVLGFTLAVILVTGVVVGLAPAVRSSKFALAESLREAGKGTTISVREGKLRNLLVISEITLAVVLLVGAGLMIRSITRLQAADRGLNTDNVLTMQIFLPHAKYPSGRQVVNFYQQLIQQVETLPGVESASVINYPPLGLISTTVPFIVEGGAPPTREEAPIAGYAVISPEYFRTIRIPLLAGRQFTQQDADETHGVVVISNSMAFRFWPHEDALGKRISPQFPEMSAYWIPESKNLWLTVVGVVGDVRQDGRIGVPEDQTNLSQIYLPYRQNPSPIMHLMVRTETDSLGWAAAVRAKVYAVDRDQPVFDVKTMEEVVAESFSGSRVVTLLLSAFAALALFLAAVGIYGVMSYTVRQRTHEIGIRMALGAEQWDVLKLIVRQGMFLALTGLIVGLIAAFVLSHVMSSALYGVGVGDPVTYAGVSGLLIGVAFIACYVPAHRATKVDPMIAVRYE